MMEDITARKGAEEELWASEARLAHQAFHWAIWDEFTSPQN